MVVGQKKHEVWKWEVFLLYFLIFESTLREYFQAATLEDMKQFPDLLNLFDCKFEEAAVSKLWSANSGSR